MRGLISTIATPANPVDAVRCHLTIGHGFYVERISTQFKHYSVSLFSHFRVDGTRMCLKKNYLAINKRKKMQPGVTRNTNDRLRKYYGVKKIVEKSIIEEEYQQL